MLFLDEDFINYQIQLYAHLSSSEYSSQDENDDSDKRRNKSNFLKNNDYNNDQENNGGNEQNRDLDEGKKERDKNPNEYINNCE